MPKIFLEKKKKSSFLCLTQYHIRDIVQSRDRQERKAKSPPHKKSRRHTKMATITKDIIALAKKIDSAQ